MKGKRRIVGVCLVILACILLTAMPVLAKTKKPKAKWKRTKEAIYYYNEKGKKVTGLKKIRKKYYYFDSKGIQRYGWKKIGNNYYFFRPGRGKNAYMVKNEAVNGIVLDKRGRAASDAHSQRKAKLLAVANSTVESITKPLMPKKEKLRICFEYTKTHFKYLSRRRFRAVPNWELDFAEDMFYYGYGNCFSYGAAFACLASAVGYNQVYAISSGGHGWAEVNGLVYDPDWALVSKVDTYFAMPYSLSGVSGRPRYAPNRAYVSKI